MKSFVTNGNNGSWSKVNDINDGVFSDKSSMSSEECIRLKSRIWWLRSGESSLQNEILQFSFWKKNKKNKTNDWKHKEYKYESIL